jgi:hypothetical protein
MVTKMQACKKHQKLIAAHWFGDLTIEENRRLAMHVETCAACREAMALGTETLNTIGKPARPTLPEHFWEGYWLRLTQKMDAQDASERGAWSVKRLAFLRAPWSPALRLSMAAAIFVCGILISKMWWMPEQRTQVTQAPPAGFQVTPVEARDPRAEALLSRSKVLLIGLASLDADAVRSEDFSFSVQRQFSRRLLAEAKTVRKNPDTAKDQQLAQLVTQLEMVLLQIANLEVEHDVSAVELVRASIDREGLLLKINIEEMKRQTALQPKTHAL